METLRSFFDSPLIIRLQEPLVSRSSLSTSWPLLQKKTILWKFFDMSYEKQSTNGEFFSSVIKEQRVINYNNYANAVMDTAVITDILPKGCNNFHVIRWGRG